MLIGMNVELGDTLTTALSQQSSEVGTQLTSLTNAVSTLLNSWMGNSRGSFENEWEPWVGQVHALINQMDDMQRRLTTTVEAFRSADIF